MLNKVLFSAAMLLLVSANAMSMKCGDMTPEDCKKEFGMEMDKMVMTIFSEMMKTQIMKRIEVYATVKNELPADSMHAKLLMQGIDAMKAQMPKIDKMDGMDAVTMGVEWNHILMAMQSDFSKADAENSDNTEKMKEIMDKHIDMANMEEGIATMMKKFETMGMEMMDSLRPEDMKEYPQYMEMKNMMKTMMETIDSKKKMDMFKEITEKMLHFNETPYIKAMINMMTNGCNDCPYF